MSLRIMSWNIQDLSLTSKIAPTLADPNQERAVYILLSIIGRNPAILVVVEVETGRPPVYDARGYLVTDTSGGPAVRWIHQALRALQPGNDWRVVPPLLSGALGRKEGIAVFFDNHRVNFRGPYQVANDPIGAQVYQYSRQVMGPAPAWAPPWAGALPPAPPAGPAIGGGLNQDQLAGQPYFATGPGLGAPPLLFPDPHYRSPYLTEFIEVNVPAPRILKVLGVHLPPFGGVAAMDAVANVPLIPEMYTVPMTANEVRVICGDFNVDALDPAGVGLLAPLKTTNVPLAAGGTTRYEDGEFKAPSMLRRVLHASTAGVMPYLGYTATQWNWVNQVYAPGNNYPDYDGIYVAYGTYPDDPPHGYVMNRVVGTPPNLPEVPQGMAIPMAQLLTWPHPPPVGFPTRDQIFQMMPNYGKIFGASDHMPVYCDI